MLHGIKQRMNLGKNHAAKVALRAVDLLVAENGLHSFICRLRNPTVERHQHIQIVHLTLDQTIYSPEDGIQI